MMPSHEALDRRVRWESQYRNGPTPWDTGVTPPEVQEFWRSGLLPADSLAIDMGCGTGTNVAYLAGIGLHAIGLELSRAALDKARTRVERLPEAVASRIAFVQCDVAAPPLQSLGASYILDIGCLHTVPPPHRREYAAGVIDNLAPGGFYHLFAHDVPADAPANAQADRGMGDTEVAELFTPALHLLTVVRGRPDQRPCRWYLLRRPVSR